MILALNRGDLGYDLLLLLHLVAVIVGFGSSFVWPFMGAESGRQKGPVGLAFAEFALKTSKWVTTHAIYAAGLLGLILAIIGDFMDQTWVHLSMTLFVAMSLFAALVHVPNLTRMTELAREIAAAGPPVGGPPPQAAEIERRGKAAARNGGILHLGFLVLMALMVFKP